MGHKPVSYTIADQLKLKIQFEQSNGELAEHVLPFDIAWTLYRVARELNPAYSFNMALYGIVITRPHVEISNEERERLEHYTVHLASALIRMFPAPEDMLLETSYQGLYQKLLSRVSAAQLAGEMLGEHVEVDTWRKRVDKYARDKGKPRLNLTGGRPKKPGK